MLEHFVRWLEGGPPMETHAAANVLSLAIVFAAIESVETGRRDQHARLLRKIWSELAGEVAVDPII